MMAGLAGGLFSSWTSFIDPFSFILLESILLVSIVILGGACDHMGIASGRDGVRTSRRGDEISAVRAYRAYRADKAGGSRTTAGIADAVQAAGTGWEVQAVKDSRSGSEPVGDFALETSEVSKRFGAVRAVDRLSISIPRRGATSIVGPNGSGKSTLVNLLSGVLPLDGGLVIIDGNGLRVVKAYDSPEHGVTRTFQDVRLFDQITVWDNIMVTLTERRVFHSLFQRRSAERDDKARAHPPERRNVGEGATRSPWTCPTASESCWRLAAPCLWTSARICSMSLSPVCFPRCWRASRTS